MPDPKAAWNRPSLTILRVGTDTAFDTGSGADLDQFTLPAPG